MWSTLDNVHSHHNLWHAVNCIMTPVKRTISIRKRSLTLFPSWAFIVLSHFTSFHQPQSHYCIISRVTFIILVNKAKQWVRIGNRDRSQFWNRTLPPVHLSCHPAFSMACIISTIPVVFGHSSLDYCFEMAVLWRLWLIVSSPSVRIIDQDLVSLSRNYPQFRKSTHFSRLLSHPFTGTSQQKKSWRRQYGRT